MEKPYQEKKKIITIVGPTASGKTDLSVKLALEFNGEIISADSRQVYKRLDIGTEKIPKDEMMGIKHHLIDVAEPSEIFSVKDFKETAEKAISNILQVGKLPIIVGGTGFYIDNLVNDIQIPEVKPNEKLREELNKKTADELFEILKQKDPNRASSIDKKNKKRLIRSLEIIEEIGFVPELKSSNSKYEVLQIGIKTENEKLKEKIEKRLNKSLLKGLVRETKNLLESGLKEDRIIEFGLEYKIALKFLKNEIDESQMMEEMKNELWQYAKRQKTWFKRNKDIKWFSVDEVNKIKKEVDNFLN